MMLLDDGAGRMISYGAADEAASMPQRAAGMVVVDSADQFLAAPVGQCLVREGYLVWCASPSLAGVIQWGSLNMSFVEELVALGSRLVVDRLVAPRVLCDLRDVVTVDVDDIVLLASGARMPRPDPRARIAGLTVVLPGGLSGLVVAGAAVVLAPTCRPVFTSDLAWALAACGDDVVAGYPAIEEVAVCARGTSFVASRVREHLAGDLAGATMKSCATALRVSPRTLQRRLHAAGTSFCGLQRHARVNAAWQLVRFSDLKIDAIASRVGLRNASRMGAIFRAEFGMTPTELRSAAR